MFKVRLFSGLVLLALTGVVNYLGGLYLLVFLGAAAFAGLFEFYRLKGLEKTSVAVTGYVLTGVWLCLLYLAGNSCLSFMPAASLLVFLFLYVFSYPKVRSEDLITGFFGFSYVPLLLGFWYLLRAYPNGRLLVWLILLSSWGSDTLAYCAGRLFGRHKMTPVLSPKKTWEGAAGGLIGAVLLGMAYAAFFNEKLIFNAGFSPVFICGAACGAGALVSMAGDLAASGFKRDHGIKDYGTLIPGHGGILDRFDSVLTAAPAVYAAVVLLTK